jgi:hypothetical protein
MWEFCVILVLAKIIRKKNMRTAIRRIIMKMMMIMIIMEML